MFDSGCITGSTTSQQINQCDPVEHVFRPGSAALLQHSLIINQTLLFIMKLCFPCKPDFQSFCCLPLYGPLYGAPIPNLRHQSDKMVCHTPSCPLQSILTGESDSVEKNLDTVLKDGAVYQDKTCCLFSVRRLPLCLSAQTNRHSASSQFFSSSKVCRYFFSLQRSVFKMPVKEKEGKERGSRLLL